MQIGMAIHKSLPWQLQISCMRELGIDHTFVAGEQEDFHQIMDFLRENGIICDNLHAPFSGINAMWGDDPEAAESMIARLNDSIDKCAQYHIPVVIVHLSSGRPMPEINETGLRRFERVFAYAEAKGVTVALENQRYKENLMYFMEHYPRCGFCWDCGHAYAMLPSIDFMALYGHRLAALHLDDNRCIMDADDHLLPFDGNADWEQIAKDIAKSGYTGTLMLEVVRSTKFDDKLFYGELTDEAYMERAAKAVRRLNDMVEIYREG